MSFGSFRRAPVIVWFIGVCLAHYGGHQGLFVSFTFVWLIRARPGCCLVHSVRFILSRPGCRRAPSGSFGSYGRAPEIVRFIQVYLAHSGAPRGSSGSFTLIRARPGGRRVHSVLLGSFMDARVSLDSFGFVWFTPVRPGCRRLHSGWYGSFGCALGVAGFIRSLLVHSGEPLWSFQIVCFSWSRPAYRPVYSSSLG